MKNQKKKNFTNDKKEFNSIIETILETETVIQMIEKNYYETQMEKANNADVNINHLENIFTNKTYYTAMKIVPLFERKILFLSYVENCRLNDICRRLKLEKKEVIKLRNKGIEHFKNNLKTLYKANTLQGGKL